MNIGIIGSGNVGGTLGRRWAGNGHRVVFASRDPGSEKTKKLVSEAGANARAGKPSDAAASSEVILIATPWDAAEPAVRAAGSLSGKVVIDATNPLLPGLAGLAVGCSDSAAERIAKAAAGARVVKAFNTVGANIMSNPVFGGGKVAMFYCGDDAEAKMTVGGLIAELGFEPLDAGPLQQARVLEPFATLWISLAMRYGYGREIGFELLRR